MIKKILLSFIFLFTYHYSTAQLHVDTTKSVKYLIQSVLLDDSPNIEILNYGLKGNKQATGILKNEMNIEGIPRGILLTTGHAMDAVGKNDKPNTGYNYYLPGNKALSLLAGENTYDALVLYFEFIPYMDSIGFSYLFASEEYPEYIEKGVNDVFAFFLQQENFGKAMNLAKIPGTGQVVSIDNINHTNNAQYYRDNSIIDAGTQMTRDNYLSFLIQYDGISNMLHAGARVIPGQKYTLYIAIADAGDAYYDTGVLLKAKSFQCSPSSKHKKRDFVGGNN